jgi:hypothetical protein
VVVAEAEGYGEGEDRVVGTANVACNNSGDRRMNDEKANKDQKNIR